MAKGAKDEYLNEFKSYSSDFQNYVNISRSNDTIVVNHYMNMAKTIFIFKIRNLSIEKGEKQQLRESITEGNKSFAEAKLKEYRNNPLHLENYEIIQAKSVVYDSESPNS